MPTVAVNYPWYSYENTLSIHIIYTTKYSSANTAQSNIRKIDMSQLQIQLVNLCVLLLQVDLPHFLPCTRSEERKKQKKLSRNPRLVECRRISRTEFILKSLSNKTNCTKQGSIKLYLLAYDISFLYIHTTIPSICFL